MEMKVILKSIEEEKEEYLYLSRSGNIYLILAVKKRRKLCSAERSRIKIKKQKGHQQSQKKQKSDAWPLQASEGEKKKQFRGFGTRNISKLRGLFPVCC